MKKSIIIKYKSALKNKICYTVLKHWHFSVGHTNPQFMASCGTLSTFTAYSLPLPYFSPYFVDFPIPFYHLLWYNTIVIRDIYMYVSWCRVHLLPLLFVCGNFPVALKMYFLCSAVFPLPAGSMPNTAAL